MELYKNEEWTISSAATKSFYVGDILWYISFTVKDEHLSRLLYCDSGCIPDDGHLVLISMTAYDGKKKIGSDDQLFLISSCESKHQMGRSWKIDISLRIQFHFQMIKRDCLDKFKSFIDPSYRRYILNENQMCFEEVNKLLKNYINKFDHPKHLKRVYGKSEKREKERFGARAHYLDIHQRLQSLFMHENVENIIVLDLFSSAVQAFESHESEQLRKNATAIMIPWPLKKFHRRDCGKGSDRRSIYLARSFVRRFFNLIFYTAYSENKLSNEFEKKLLNEIQRKKIEEIGKAKKNAARNAKKKEREKKKKNQKREAEEMKIKEEEEEEKKKRKDKEEKEKKMKDEEEKRQKLQNEKKEKIWQEKEKAKQEKLRQKKAKQKEDKAAKKEALENYENKELENAKKETEDLLNVEKENAKKKDVFEKPEKDALEKETRRYPKEQEDIQAQFQNAIDEVNRKMAELAEKEHHIQVEFQNRNDALDEREKRIQVQLQNAIDELNRGRHQLAQMEQNIQIVRHQLAQMKQNIQIALDEVDRGRHQLAQILF